VLSRREVVTPRNRHRIMAESFTKNSGNEGLNPAWMGSTALRLYHMDVEEYLGMSLYEAQRLANEYDTNDIRGFQDLKEYYGSRGKEQLARQAIFHTAPHCLEEMEFIYSVVNTATEGYGCEYGCGSAPVSFELALRGHRMDFIDIDGA